MKKVIVFILALLATAAGQNYYYDVWRASNRFFFAEDFKEDGNQTLFIGGEFVNDYGTFFVFDASARNLLRAYYLQGTGYASYFVPQKMVHFGDTVVVAGRTLVNNYAVITKFTKGSLTTNPQLLKVSVFRAPVCSNCGGYYSEFEDLKMRNDTLFAIGSLNDAGNRKVLLVLFNKNLDTLKTVTYDYPANTNSDYGLSLKFASNGDLLISGTTYGLGGTYGDMLVIRANPQGELLWAKVLGYEDYDYGLNILEDDNGNIYVLGFTDGGSSSVPNAMLVFKLSPTGMLIWHKYINWNHGSSAIKVQDWKYLNGKFIITPNTYSNVIGYEETAYLVIVDTLGSVELIKRLGPASTDMIRRPIIARVSPNKALVYSHLEAANAGYYSALYAMNVSLDTSSYCFPEDTFTPIQGSGFLTDSYIAYNVAPANLIDTTNIGWLAIQPAAVNKVSICDTCTLPAPVANFSYADSALTVTFTDNSSNATSYLWDFGDGNTSTQQNPTHTYATQGTYKVCLTVSNDCGSDSVCQNITVTPTAFATTNQGNIQIFYNNNILNIKNIPGRGTLKIHTINGQLLLRKKLVKTSYSFPVDLSKGIYIYSLELENGIPVYGKMYVN